MKKLVLALILGLCVVFVQENLAENLSENSAKNSQQNLAENSSKNSAVNSNLATNSSKNLKENLAENSKQNLAKNSNLNANLAVNLKQNLAENLNANSSKNSAVNSNLAANSSKNLSENSAINLNENSAEIPQQNSNENPPSNAENTATEQNLSISKGQVLILEFQKQGLQSIKSRRNAQKSEVRERFFDNPSDENKVVLIFGSGYKNPIKEAHIVALYGSGKRLEYDLLGDEGVYEKEILQVAQSKVTPPKEVLKRIQSELAEARTVYATYTNEALFRGKFILPLNSVITSRFGTARVFNGTLMSYHSGTDFRAAVGTAVVAANDGIVRLAKDRYYAGGSIIIDHGYKIFTQYYHLSELKVKVGQRVKKGDVIALSGDTGRVTGAHLHFGVIAGGTQVDPLDFIEKFNGIFK